MSGSSTHLSPRNVGEPVDDHEQLLIWRRRALDQQLPAAAFPAGSGTPSLVYLCSTMLLVTVAILGFAVNAHRGVLPAVLDSQANMVTKLASDLRVGARNTAEDLELSVAERGTTTDADLLTQVVDKGEFAGASVVDIASRQTLAAKGEALPVDLLPAELPIGDTVSVTTVDGPMFVYTTAMDDARALLAMQPVTMRNLRLNPDARHGVHVLTPDGKSTLVQGLNAVDPGYLPAVFDQLAGSGSRQSREIVVKEWADRRLVVSSAPVRGTDLVVISLLTSEVSEGTSGVKGLLLGLSLLVIATVSFLLMRMSLVRPVRALLAQAKAAACGIVTPNRTSMRIREAQVIDRALALTSGERHTSDDRWRPTVMQGLAFALLLALLWPVAAVALAFQTPDPAVPTQVVRDEENRAETASQTLGRYFHDGLAMVSDLSRSVDPTDLAHARRALAQQLAAEKRFRALYLVDRDGRTVAHAGREPLRTTEPVPSEAGIDFDDEIRRLPVVYAYKQIAEGHAVVGEFDPDQLVSLVRRVVGRVRVVDAELRTILDSKGYQAFQPLKGDLARDVAVEVLPGTTAGRSSTADGRPALVAASGLTVPSTVAHLEWAVVVEQDPVALRLPEMIERRWTLLVAGAVVGTIVLTHVWQFYIFVRPLRRLAAHAGKMSEGKIDVPVPPQRHDDIGAIAMCLEVCRQVRHAGSARLGGALRLRGPGDDRTSVLPRVPRQNGTHARAMRG